MNLLPLINAPLAIQAHVAAILLAMLSVITIPFVRRGRLVHRLAGRTFAVAMVLAALTSFFITEIDPGSFSLIHLLSIFVLVSIFMGWRAAQRGNINGHASWMIGTAVGGLGVAGVMAFAEPARRMYQVFIG